MGRAGSAQNDLLQFRVITQRWALPISFSLGLLLAGSVCVFWIDSSTLQRVTYRFSKVMVFEVADIVAPAALLAGGADSIHKVLFKRYQS